MYPSPLRCLDPLLATTGSRFVVPMRLPFLAPSLKANHRPPGRGCGRHVADWPGGTTHQVLNFSADFGQTLRLAEQVAEESHPGLASRGAALLLRQVTYADRGLSAAARPAPSGNH